MSRYLAIRCIALLPLLAWSSEEPLYVGPKHKKAYDNGGDSRDKNCSGRDILRVANERVELRRRCVSEKLECGVERLGCPDDGDS